jgi:electron transfer flavoprotein alpha subunit
MKSMGSGAGPVWVVAEQLEGRIQAVSLQLIGCARCLADELGVAAEAVLLGEGTAALAPDLVAAGTDRIYLGDHRNLRSYDSELYAQLLEDLARRQGPEIVLFGSTPVGTELAPLMAARLSTGLTVHCIDLALNDDGILEQRVPAYGGVISIVCPTRRPQMAMISRGVFPTPVLDRARAGEIVPLDVPDEIPRRLETLEIVREAAGGVSLESATTIVAGGAGVGDPAGWLLVSDLACALNAALGSTRPVVDEGWAELETMIGQSGKMVNPELYIGVGLSGEQQHMVGITEARVMVAINSNTNAPIFGQVDLGVVDDLREFLPVLIEKIVEYRTA